MSQHVTSERGLLSAEDRERIEFLHKLDAAARINVTDWEANFIEDFLQRPRSMTTAQRAAVDAMRSQYEGEI